MQLRRLTFVFAFFAALAFASPSIPELAVADAKTSRAGRAGKKTRKKRRSRRYRKGKRRRKASRYSKARRKRRRRKTRRRRRRRRKGYYKCRYVKRRGSKRRRRRCRFVRHFQGRSVRTAELRTSPLTRPSGKIALYNVHFRKTVNVNIYDADGDFDDAALAKLDNNFRCWRTGNERAVDPRLYEMLSRIYDHFGKKRIELVSGFRYQRNESSRHFHGSASDIRISGVTTRQLYNYARSLDVGGMGIGIYPKSGFVHMDFRAPGVKSYRWTDTSPKGSARIRRWK